MERLDAVACRDMAAQIPGTPVFTSDNFDMFQLVSILRACSYMVSSRYHGIVTSMPSLVASAGVTMDERIRNLMRERGHQHRSEEHTSELQSRLHIVCRLLLEKKKPRNADAFAGRGDARARRLDFQGALDDFTQALSIDADNADAYVGRAAIRTQLGDHAGALNDYNAALRLNFFF